MRGKTAYILSKDLDEEVEEEISEVFDEIEYERETQELVRSMRRYAEVFYPD